MKHVLFLTGASGRDKWFYGLAQELKKHADIEDHYITEFLRNNHFFKQQGLPKKRYHYCPPFKQARKADLEYLRKKEEEWGINIWDAWESIRERGMMRRWKRDDILRNFTYLAKRLETIVERTKPDFLICYGIAGHYQQLLFRMAESKGITIIEPKPSFELREKFTISNNFEERWPLLQKAYQDMRRRPLTKEEKKEAKGIHENYLHRETVQFLVNRNKDKWRIVKKLIKSVKVALFIEHRLPKDISPLIYYLRGKAALLLGFFKKHRDSKKYVYFPLHYQPEITTLIWGKWYVDQVNLIKIIAKSIPADYRIVVKEHPYNFSNKKYSFYRELKRLPTVELLSPYYNGFDLIRNTDLIITITGTTGMEGMLYGKPVITFGDVFYNLMDGVTKIERIEDLPHIIREKLKEKPDEEEVRRFLLAMRRAEYPGLAMLPEDCNEESLKEENVRLLCEGIMDYVERHTEKSFK